ncbi:MAG TPA: Na/Pi cotransporter family protein [Dongiaceae bacterium]
MVTGIVLDLAGAVALLLWGLHMVHSGAIRAFGSDLRRFLGTALGNRAKALLAGLGVTALLQSSTATALMVSSFAAGGLVDLVPALAVMLGANIGTTVIAQILSFDVTAVAPVFFIAGVTAFRRGRRGRTRDFGRMAIGLGLMLLSLHWLVSTLEPAENAPLVRDVLGSITGQPIANMVLAAILTWAAHSSLAVVLLVMSFAHAHVVTPVAALALVLGANLGSAINPVVEAGYGRDLASRRLPIGNLLNRTIGSLLVLPLLPWLSGLLAGLEADPARQAVDFHTAFNLVLAAVFILPLDAFAGLLTRLLPAGKAAPNPGAPLYLDVASLANPPEALALAVRETLHVGDIVEIMLRRTLDVLLSDDRKLIDEISRMDDSVDHLTEEIKLYVTRIPRASLSERDDRRAMEIISFAINLEHVGDIVDNNLLDIAAKKIKNRRQFSHEGAAELAAFHARLVRQLDMAFSIFLTGDTPTARRLVEEKAAMRQVEADASESHLARLRQGRIESIETSALHLDVLRDLKRICAHICSVAYPVLEAGGELQRHRLRDPKKQAETPAAEVRPATN